MANPTPKNNQRPDRAGNRKAGNTQLSPEEKSNLLAKQFGLKQGTKDFIDELIRDPKQDIGEAYLKTHKTLSKRNASSAGSKLLKKPAVIGYRDSAVGKAKRKVVALIDSSNESIALKASESVIDRNEGKAITKQEITQKTVVVKLDLSGVKLGAHYVRPEVNSP